MPELEKETVDIQTSDNVESKADTVENEVKPEIEVDHVVNSNNTNHETPTEVPDVSQTQNVKHGEIETENVVKAQEENKKNGMSQFERQKLTRKIVSKIISFVTWVISLCLLLLCLSNLYQQTCNPSGYTGFFGIGEAVVASNSMEPKLYANDLIFYKELGDNKVGVGDIIVYEKHGANDTSMLIVHQVVEINDDQITTKGLNNTQEDEAFPESDIVGKYMFKIPQIGGILNILSTKWAPLVVAIFLVFVCLTRIFIYCVNRKRIISAISSKKETREAIDYFFDI